jgi:hypothetical protein
MRGIGFPLIEIGFVSDVSVFQRQRLVNRAPDARGGAADATIAALVKRLREGQSESH